jgi:hypothetical protein
MFGLFKKQTEQVSPRRIPRGVLPTFVTDESVILCKKNTSVRNTYEIRLLLYMAEKNGKNFVLKVPPGAKVDDDLRVHLQQHVGFVQEMEIESYSIYIGHKDAKGEEGDGWVFGDSDAWLSFIDSLQSHWLKQHLVVGASFAGENCTIFEQELKEETVSQTNIDDGNVKEALLALLAATHEQGGEVYIQ